MTKKAIIAALAAGGILLAGCGGETGQIIEPGVTGVVIQKIHEDAHRDIRMIGKVLYTEDDDDDHIIVLRIPYEASPINAFGQRVVSSGPSYTEARIFTYEDRWHRVRVGDNYTVKFGDSIHDSEVEGRNP